MADRSDKRQQTIPGLQFLCGPPVLADGRLKVFWPDDRTKIVITEDVKPFVHVTRVLAPESAEMLLHATRGDILQQRGGEVYELPDCPHDVYLADFRLSDAETREFGGTLSLAAYAEAAGMTTAVLMAASFPGHPATIIPYTAYKEELQAQQDLLKRLCPEFLNVKWGGELGKLDRGTNSALKSAIAEHRDYLPVAAARGFVHVRAAEREKLEKMMLDTAAGRMTVPWDLRIEMETQWGRRSLLLFSLWPELRVEPGAPVTAKQLTRKVLPLSSPEPDAPVGDAERLVPAVDLIVNWLRMFPSPTRVQRTAADLAYTFFCQRLSLRSHDRYMLSGWLRNGFGPKDEPEVGVLCTAVGLDLDAVQTYAEAVKAANCTERELEKAQSQRRSLEKKNKGRAGQGGEHRTFDVQVEDSKQAETQAQESELLALLERQREAVRQCGDPVMVPKAWTCPHLLSRETKAIADKETLRLAVLFLLVYEATYRWRCSELLAENLEERSRSGSAEWLASSPYTSANEIAGFVAEVRRRADAMYAHAADTTPNGSPRELREVQMGLQPLAELLGVENALAFVEDLDPEAKELWRAMMPVTSAAVVRLIDPLPEQIQTADTDFTEGRIGVALARVGLKVLELLGGRGKGGASEAEEEAMARFALDIGFAPRAWPLWLSWPTGKAV